MSQQAHFAKDVLNGVEIDRPLNHELITYAKGFGVGNQPISKYDHPGSAIQSVKYKGVDKYDDEPVFTVRFKVEFDSVQEIAANFWRFNSPLKIVELLNDGIIVEVEEASAACSIDTVQNPVMDTRYANHPNMNGIDSTWPVTCAYLKDAILEAGSYDAVTDEAHEEIENKEHWCSGNIYEVAVGVAPEGSDKPANIGEYTVDLFNEDEYEVSLFTATDEEVREALWEDPDLLTTVTAPNGKKYRVISVMHED